MTYPWLDFNWPCLDKTSFHTYISFYLHVWVKILNVLSFILFFVKSLQVNISVCDLEENFEEQLIIYFMLINIGFKY